MTCVLPTFAALAQAAPRFCEASTVHSHDLKHNSCTLVWPKTQIILRQRFGLKHLSIIHPSIPSQVGSIADSTLRRENWLAFGLNTPQTPIISPCNSTTSTAAIGPNHSQNRGLKHPIHASLIPPSIPSQVGSADSTLHQENWLAFELQRVAGSNVFLGVKRTTSLTGTAECHCPVRTSPIHWPCKLLPHPLVL
jgi:hypothetical protein